MSTSVHRVLRTYTIPQLRGLVHNELTRINELSAAMESMDITELTPAWRVKCEQADAQLKHYQRLLAAYELAATSNTIPPAAPSTETSAGSLVTNEAAQPGSSS